MRVHELYIAAHRRQAAIVVGLRGVSTCCKAASQDPHDPFGVHVDEGGPRGSRRCGPLAPDDLQGNVIDGSCILNKRTNSTALRPLYVVSSLLLCGRHALCG